MRATSLDRPPYEFAALMQQLNLADSAKHLAETSDSARGVAAPTKVRRVEDIADPFVPYLATHGLLKAIEGDGRVLMRCPWEHEHTTDSGPTATVYIPAGVGGVDRGGFKCFHAHCKDRTTRDCYVATGFDNVVSEMEVIEPPPAKRFKLLTPIEALAMSPMRWLSHRLLPAEGLAFIYGVSGSGKSNLAVDGAAAWADGRDWFGHRTKKANARIVMVILEGEAGFRRRLRAWEVRHGRAFPANVRFVFDPFRLNVPADVAALVQSIEEEGGADLIIIDTLARAMPGADENSSVDMGRVIEGCGALQRAIGGLVLVVHHAGKDASKGLRGHSSTLAAADVVIEVIRSGDQRSWRIEKSKDDVDGEAHGFRLEAVSLGEDEDGDEISSCVVVPDSAPVTRRPKPPTSGGPLIALNALTPLFREGRRLDQDDDAPTRLAISRDAAIAAVREHMNVEPKRRTERAVDAIERLIARGTLGSKGEWLWLA